MTDTIRYLKIANFRSIDVLELHDIKPFSVFAGPNGAGKTTTLNMIIAEEGATCGSVSTCRVCQSWGGVWSTGAKWSGKDYNAEYDNSRGGCNLWKCKYRPIQNTLWYHARYNSTVLC